MFDTLPATGELAAATYPSSDRHPAAVYLAGLAPGSRRTMHMSLNAIANVATGQRCDIGTMPWHLLEYQHTAAIRSHLAEQFAPATANKMLSALRGVLKAAWRLGHMDGATYHRAADLPSVKGARELSGRALTRGELTALFAACKDGKPAGVRDAALLAVLYGAGLRRSEAVAIDLAHYHADAGELRIIGKGNRERTIPVAQGTAAALTQWLKVRGHEPGPLFCPVNRGGKVTIRRMTGQAVLGALVKRVEQTKIADASPHDLRRSFITHLLDAGADALSVQKLAGHANTQTTLRYDRRDEKVKRKAVNLLYVPFAA